MKVLVYSERGSGKKVCEDAACIGKYVMSDIYREEIVDDDAFIGISDGVGGNAGGDLASRFVLDSISKKNLVNLSIEKLQDIVTQINNELLEYASMISGKEKMGTTLTGIIFYKEYASIIHIGNSRIYGMQGNYLKQLTADHTTYQWLINCGQVQNAEVCNRNELIFCMGGGNHQYIKGLSIEKYSISKMPYRFIMTTDGIHDYLSIDYLEQFMQGELNKSSFRELSELANENGSADDKTIIVIDRG